MGQSNIESFRLAAGDPDAVAVKTATIAAAMLKAAADDLLGRWATVLGPVGGAVASGGCAASEPGTRALSGGRFPRTAATRSIARMERLSAEPGKRCRPALGKTL